MSKGRRHRGGRRHEFKKKGRLNTKQQRRLYDRTQLNAGYAPDGMGKWFSVSDLQSEKIRQVYQGQFGGGKG